LRSARLDLSSDYWIREVVIRELIRSFTDLDLIERNRKRVKYRIYF
jgi:hypothetical protein